MNRIKVPGKNNNHAVFLYTLSTCAWCKMTKQFLKNNDVDYEYVDVDLCDNEDRERIRKDILKRGGRPSYPIIMIDDESLIIGFHKDKLEEVLGL